MIRYFRALLEALQEAATALSTGVSLLYDLREGSSPDGLLDRLEKLERSRAEWEAEVEAELIRADSRFRAARAAEERARTKEKNAEAATDLLDEESVEELPPEYLRLLQKSDAVGGEEEGMHPVRDRVATRAEGKALARQLKWGG